MELTYEGMQVPDEQLHPIWRDLYHSKGPGYYIFRNFISPEFVEHIRKYWSEIVIPKASHKSWYKNFYYAGSPNYVAYQGPTGKNVSFFNFLWNDPSDQVSHAVATQALLLRNRIEGEPNYYSFHPLKDRRSLQYRIIMVKEGRYHVKPHRDYIGNRPRNPWDPKRLQGTIILAEHGKDYDGDGFIFERNDGKKVVFGKDVKVKPGDFVLWRFFNEHSVENVTATDDQVGFMRMILPAATIHDAPALSGAKAFARQALRDSPGLTKVLRVPYRMVKKVLK